jgi:hypothetical protein
MRKCRAQTRVHSTGTDGFGISTPVAFVIFLRDCSSGGGLDFALSSLLLLARPRSAALSVSQPREGD